MAECKASIVTLEQMRICTAIMPQAYNKFKSLCHYSELGRALKGHLVTLTPDSELQGLQHLLTSSIMRVMHMKTLRQKLTYIKFYKSLKKNVSKKILKHNDIQDGCIMSYLCHFIFFRSI